MIDYVPTIEDGANVKLFVPMLATLYGRDAAPHRYVRVVKSYEKCRNTLSFESVPGDPSTLAIVETVDTQTFLQFASYGYTPYIECLLSGYRGELSFRQDQENYFVSQAALRNYEKRSQTLIELCERKKLSLKSSSVSNTVTGELVDELEGVQAIWEMLMNTGTMHPANCLSFVPGKRSYSSIPIKKFQGTHVELGDRLAMNNFMNLQFKVTPEQRSQLLQADKMTR